MNILDMYKGNEELALEGDVVAVAEQAAEEVARAEVAEATVEMQEAAQQVEVLTEKMEEMEETVEELEETVDGMESLLSSGNFSAIAMTSLYNRAAKLNDKLGGKSVSRMGAENFSDASTARLLARDGMEGFMDKVKGWAKTAIEFIKNIFNAVINFFVGLVNKTAGLQRRIDATRKRLDAAEKLKEKVKLGKWNLFVDYEKNGAKGALLKNFSWKDKLDAYLNVAKDVEKANLSAFNSAYDSLVSALKEAAKDMADAGVKESGSDTKQVIADNGGIRVLVTFHDGEIKSGEDAVAAARKLKVMVGKTPESKLGTGEVDAKADKATLGSTLTSLAGYVKTMRESKIQQKFSKAERDRVIGRLNAIAAGNAGSEDMEKSRKESVSIVKAVYSSGASVTKTLVSLTGDAVDAGISMVAAHV